MYLQSVQKLDALFLAAICAIAMAVQAFGAPPAAKPAAKADAHEHAEVGPHKGALIELGEEEYHAEFVLDEKTHTVSIYLMDGAVKNYVAIPAKEITVTLKHDGKPESFKLKAKPQKTDPAGMSSMSRPLQCNRNSAPWPPASVSRDPAGSCGGEISPISPAENSCP